MEFILGMLFTPLALCICILLSVLFEHKDARGFAGFTFLIGGTILYNLLGLSLTTLGIAAALWLPIGLAWSMWRWSRHCSKTVKRAEAFEISRNAAKSEIDFKEKSPTLVYWVIFWPISLVEMLLSDIFDVIETLVTKVFQKTYARIAGNANAKLDKLSDSTVTWKEHNQPTK
jgi:hypothetical protein